MGKSNPKVPPSLLFNGDPVTDNYDVAKAFNDYFGRIGNTLSNNVKDIQIPFNTYLPDPVPFHFTYDPRHCRKSTL